MSYQLSVFYFQAVAIQHRQGTLRLNALSPKTHMMMSQMRSGPSFASALNNIQLLYSLKHRVMISSIEPKFDSRTPRHRQGSPNDFMIPQPNHSSYRSFSISRTDHIHGSAIAHTCLLSIICRFALAHNRTGDLESPRTHIEGDVHPT